MLCSSQTSSALSLLTRLIKLYRALLQPLPYLSLESVTPTQWWRARRRACCAALALTAQAEMLASPARMASTAACLERQLVLLAPATLLRRPQAHRQKRPVYHRRLHHQPGSQQGVEGAVEAGVGAGAGDNRLRHPRRRRRSFAPLDSKQNLIGTRYPPHAIPALRGTSALLTTVETMVASSAHQAPQLPPAGRSDGRNAAFWLARQVTALPQ